MANRVIALEISPGSRLETCGIPLAHLTGPGFIYKVCQRRTCIGTSRVRGTVDVILTNSNILAKHLEIIFDFPHFLLSCPGQTGVFVNGVLQRPGAWVGTPRLTHS
jgi:forkhead box protein K